MDTTLIHANNAKLCSIVQITNALTEWTLPKMHCEIMTTLHKSGRREENNNIF